MWDLNLKVGSNPLDVLNSALGDVSPKTGMKFRGAARKNARDVKVSERDGQTYVKNSLGEGARFNRNGEYRVSQTEAKRLRGESNFMETAATLRRKREDEYLKEMLAEQAEYMKNHFNS